MKYSELEPFQNPTFNFPPLPRRPLRSQTYRTFVQILSHCAALRSPQSPPKDGVFHGETSVQNLSGGNHLVPCDSVALQEPSASFLDGDIHKMPSEVSCLIPVDAEVDGKGKERDVNGLDPMDAEVEGNGKERDVNGLDAINADVEGNSKERDVNDVDPIDAEVEGNGKEREVNGLDTIDAEVEGNGKEREVNGLDTMDAEVGGDGKERFVNGVIPVDLGEENNAHIRGVCHIVDEKKSSCTGDGHKGIIEQKLDTFSILHDYEFPGFHTDTVVDVSAAPQQTDDTSLEDERDLSVELRMKEKEFEELLWSPAAVDLSVCLAGADDIEEGEVSGDDAPYETMDFLFDSAEAQVGLGSENPSGEIDMTGFFSPEEVHNSNDLLETQSTITHLDVDKISFSCEERAQINEGLKSDSAIEIGQALEKDVEVKSNLTAVAEDSATQRIIISKNSTEDGDVLTDEKDVCVAKNKKRKQSKEAKAKKKRKERIKRAEKNMKLGVKRLKLQPVVKAVKVNICRHYKEKGSCREGENCKFSHDTIPLTKSKPCGHFARRSCMKGDDCPYDHQLSKYPCNNYVNVTKGFCHRGADCMFSHEISVIDASLTSSNICKAEHSKSPVQNSDLNHSRTRQQFESNSKALEKILLPDHPQKASAAVVPKGINMISFGGSSSSSSSHKHDKTPMPVEENIVNLDQQATVNSLNRGHKSIAVANKVHPAGINFLSFGKTHPIASEGGINRSSSLFDLPSSGNNNKTRDDSNPLGTINMNSDPFTPQGFKFLSFGIKPQNNISPVVGGEKQSGSSKSSIDNDMLQGSSCSANPFSLCSDNSARTSNVSKSALKALNSTLAFAAKFDSKIKLDPCTR